MGAPEFHRPSPKGLTPQGKGAASKKDGRVK